MRNVRLSDTRAVFTFDRMLLDQHPLIAALLQRAHKFIGNIGMIRQSHLRWGEASDAAQCVQTEDGGEMVLPCLYLQAEILHWSGRGDGVSPTRSQPLYGPVISGVESNPIQILEHVIQTHGPQ